MNNLANDLEDLYDKSEKYAVTSIDLIRLYIIEKTADVVSSLTMLFVLAIFITMFALFVNISIGLFLGELLGGDYIGFLIVSGFYLMAGLVIFFFRKKIIQKPISDLIISKLLKTKIKDNDETEQ